jgi:alkylhydroperoxidase family enzyme
VSEGETNGGNGQTLPPQNLTRVYGQANLRFNLAMLRFIMDAFINPPKNFPLFLKLGIWFSERITGKKMLPARILAWYPKAAVGSGVLESLVAHHDGRMDERMLQIARVTASYAAACPFCIDMNSYQFEEQGISAEEMLVLQGRKEIKEVATFSEREKVAIQYVKLISQTPLKFYPEVITTLKQQFNEREIVILASTAAQVNYWARLIQALGIPPAGFGSPDGN